LHYTGWVGVKKFDSTIDPLKRYVPFEFIIGTGAVIKGFEKGVKEMCKGEQRKITIPPQLGYGEKGAGLIPGNENVVLLRVIV
jgi:FKBP-type peptidyl-prolyl cis-trans isomerase